MLARARGRRGRPGRGRANASGSSRPTPRGLRLPERFRLAFIALNSLFLFGDRAAQAAAVRTLAEHLAPGGLAVVDVWLPDADDLARYDGRLVLEYAAGDPETGRTVIKTGAAIHDAATQSIDLTTIYDEASQGEPPVRWVRIDRIRLVGADELCGFAEAAGLEVELARGRLRPGAARAGRGAGHPRGHEAVTGTPVDGSSSRRARRRSAKGRTSGYGSGVSVGLV